MGDEIGGNFLGSIGNDVRLPRLVKEGVKVSPNFADGNVVGGGMDSYNSGFRKPQRHKGHREETKSPLLCNQVRSRSASLRFYASKMPVLQDRVGQFSPCRTRLERLLLQCLPTIHLSSSNPDGFPLGRLRILLE